MAAARCRRLSGDFCPAVVYILTARSRVSCSYFLAWVQAWLILLVGTEPPGAQGNST